MTQQTPSQSPGASAGRAPLSVKDLGMAVIGSREFIAGFALAGVRNSTEADAQSVRTCIAAALAQQDLGIIVVQEEILTTLDEREKEKFLDNLQPIVMFISLQQEVTLNRAIKKALGIDMRMFALKSPGTQQT